jgi:hypothetical protein
LPDDASLEQASLYENLLPEWLYNDLKREEAEQSLRNDGDFLVSLSSSSRRYTLSVRWQSRARHFLLESDPVSDNLMASFKRTA